VVSVTSASIRPREGSAGLGDLEKNETCASRLIDSLETALRVQQEYDGARYKKSK
jgi:hypothetical protein